MTRPIISPCRQICRIGDDALCDGCGRTLNEVASWLRLPDEARRAVMNRVAGWAPREILPTRSSELPR